MGPSKAAWRAEAPGSRGPAQATTTPSACPPRPVPTPWRGFRHLATAGDVLGGGVLGSLRRIRHAVFRGSSFMFASPRRKVCTVLSAYRRHSEKGSMAPTELGVDRCCSTTEAHAEQ